MKATPLRLISALVWPLSIWTSLTHLEEHPADDYVERTSPIVASAVAFWICVAAAIGVHMWSAGGVTIFSDEGAVQRVRQTELSGVLWFFLPVIYLVGFWLYTARDEAFPR